MLGFLYLRKSFFGARAWGVRSRTTEETEIEYTKESVSNFEQAPINAGKGRLQTESGRLVRRPA